MDGMRTCAKGHRGWFETRLFGAICGMTFGWPRPAPATNRHHCTQPSEHLRLLQGGEVEALAGVNQRQTCVCRYDFLRQQLQCFGLCFFRTSKILALEVFWVLRCFAIEQWSSIRLPDIEI